MNYDPHTTALDDQFYDKQAAEHACRFIETFCHHVKGKWARQNQLINLLPWQRQLVQNIFGWKNPDGTRRYRTVFLYVPRKNAKSTLACAILLYVFFTEDEPGGELYSAASTREQATLIHSIAAGMIDRAPELRKRAQVYRGGSKTIKHKKKDVVFRSLASDAGAIHGTSPSFAIVDELHAHKNGDLIEALETGMGARDNPLLLICSTADYDRPSELNRRLSYAKRINDAQLHDPSFLPCIYCAEADDDWREPSVWRKANPSMGTAFGEDFLARQAKRAEAEPSFHNTFKRLHLNITTSQNEAWLNMLDWDACKTPPSDTDQRYWAGLDLSLNRDFSTLVLYGEDGSVIPYFWYPTEMLAENEKKFRLPLVHWAQCGLLRATPGNTRDIHEIHKDICEIGRTYRIQEIAYDPNFANDLAVELISSGFELTRFYQSIPKFNLGTMQLEKQVTDHHLKHGGQEILRVMAANAQLIYDNQGHAKPDRKSHGKVDGIVALAMALDRWSNAQKETSDVLVKLY